MKSELTLEDRKNLISTLKSLLVAMERRLPASPAPTNGNIPHKLSHIPYHTYSRSDDSTKDIPPSVAEQYVVDGFQTIQSDLQRMPSEAQENNGHRGN